MGTKPKKRYGWACAYTARCPQRGVTIWSTRKGPAPGQWVYKAPVCRACKRPCKPTGTVKVVSAEAIANEQMIKIEGGQP